MPDLSKIFVATTHDLSFPLAPCKRWPVAGARLTPALRQILGMGIDEHPARVMIEGTNQDYLIENDYFIPHYDHNHEVLEHVQRATRNERLIIDRARSFFTNSQQGLLTPRSKEQIDTAIQDLLAMPENTYMECARKAARFKTIVGSIIIRFETLGRIITQRNTQGAEIEYNHLQSQSIIGDADIASLRKEYHDYYRLFLQEHLAPLMHSILLADRKPDADGVLIDLMREIGKPLEANEPDKEAFVRHSIIQKMGYAAQSIDEVHSLLVAAITNEPTKSLFAESLSGFLNTYGDRYDIHDVSDILGKLDEYTALCRARVCMKREDPAYDDMFNSKDAISGIFTSPNGLLLAMRGSDNTHAYDIKKLRMLMTHGIALMERTANTRIPCNKYAPEPWIPNLDEDAPPMEKYLVDQFLTEDGLARAKRIKKAGDSLSPADAEHYFAKAFCSLGFLQGDLDQLCADIKQRRPETSLSA